MAQFPVESPSLRAHRRQRFLQIILPLLLVFVLVVIAAVFTTRSGAGGIGILADIALIWLIIPLFMLALLFFVVVCALIYAVGRLIYFIPRYTLRAQDFSTRVRAGTQRAADTAVRPIMWLHQFTAALDWFLKPPLRK